MSGVSSEFGKDFGVIHEAVITGRKVGADRKFWSILAHNEEKFRRVVELINARSTFEITVDYSRSLVKMIKAGKYNSVNDNITAEHFPVKGEGKQEKIITLFHFNRVMTSDEIKAEMDKQGFCPAEIEDLLGLGENYPELQKKLSIVALGSVWQHPDSNHGVSCLGLGGVGRRLGLTWLEFGLGVYWRFAALHK